MGKKHIIDGQERFDGLPVTVYEGKFSGAFDVDEESALRTSYGDNVVFLVTTKKGNAGFGETRLGDMRRVDTYDVVEAFAIDSKLASQWLGQAQLPQAIPGQLTIDDDDEFESVADELEKVTVPDVREPGERSSDEALKSFLYGDERP